MKDVDLLGPRLRVRRVRVADAEPSCVWFADPRVTEFLPLAGEQSLPLPEIRAYLERMSQDDEPELAVSIELLGRGLIGCGGLRQILAGDSAEISVVIGEPALWGKAYGREAMQLLMRYSFQELGLRSLWLVVRSENERGRRLFESLGFVVEETLVGLTVVKGVARDTLRMRVGADGWPRYA